MRPLIANKKAQGIDSLLPAILALTLAGVILVFGLLMLDELLDQSNEDQKNLTAWDAGNETIVGMGKFADYFDLIVLAVVISIIISLLLVVFSLRSVR